MMTFLPRAVLFDYDGVLVASEPIHNFAWMQLLDELGFPADEDLIRKGTGRTSPEILRELLDQYKPGWNPKDFDIASLTQRKNFHYLSEARKRLQTYPGVEEGLRWLQSQGILMAVVSNARRHELHETLAQLKLTSFFQQVVSREDVSAFKPDPIHYLFAAGALGTSPSTCLAVEDSPPGLESALMAKIPAAAVMTNFPRSALETPVPGRPDLKPDWIGPDMAELFRWLKSLPPANSDR